jgi:hypothetical protein
MQVLTAIPRVVMGILLAFVLVTAAWVGWALATPGDYFANGSSWLFPSVGAACLVGLAAGWAAARGLARLLIVLLSLASLCYWVFAPSGWWSHPVGP